jgi:hypothetical protein
MRYMIDLPKYDWSRDGLKESCTATLDLGDGRTLEVGVIRDPFDGPGYEIQEAVIVKDGEILETISPHLIYLVDLDGTIADTRHDPLWDVLTTSEAEAVFGLAKNTANKACQRGEIPCRKSGGAWLIQAKDAYAKWGSRITHGHKWPLNVRAPGKLTK